MADISKELQAYKEELLRILEKSNEYFEKQLSYLSAGALGLSFIVIEKVFKNFFNTRLIGVLIDAWVLLAATLLINFSSHAVASKNHRQTVKEIDGRQYSQAKVNKLTAVKKAITDNNLPKAGRKSIKKSKNEK